MRDSFVYILASPSRTLYIGVTGNLERRVYEHKLVPGFTAKYGVTRLVHVETFANTDDAIAREKELKGWRREKKVALIEHESPKWWDLSHEWYDTGAVAAQERPSLRRRGVPPFGRDDRG